MAITKTSCDKILLLGKALAYIENPRQDRRSDAGVRL